MTLACTYLDDSNIFIAEIDGVASALLGGLGTVWWHGHSKCRMDTI
jgi:hypothetical protein